VLTFRQHRQVLERILTVFISGGGLDGVAVDVGDGLAIGARERQLDALDTRLVVILNAVAVVVEPDVVTDRHAGRAVAGVDRRVVGLVRLARIVALEFGAERHHAVGARIRVIRGIIVVATLPGQRVRDAVELDLGRKTDDVVVACEQVGEGVVAVAVRRRTLDLDAISVVEHNLDSCERLLDFGIALETIAVRVAPHVVAYRYQLLN